MIIISNKLSQKLENLLKNENIEYIKTVDNPNLNEFISDHADLSVFYSEGKLFVDPTVKNYYEKNLKGRNVEIVQSESVKNTYPYDCLYNVVETEKYYIHNDVTANEIDMHFSKLNKEKLFVKQGYTRCSLIKFPSDIYLTSDYGLYKKLRYNLNIHLLKPEKIKLLGYETGFLGGCSGMVGSNTVLFTGNIKALKSYEIIKEIADNNKINIIYPDEILTDLGSIIYVEAI